MKELELSIQDIKELMEAFGRNKMGSLKIQQGEFCLKLEGQKIEQVMAPAAGTVTSVTAAAATATLTAQEPEGPVYCGAVVTSPIVGTFYASPAPDKDPYVTVGSQVKKGDVLFIIESMKLMNEVVSEHDGTVTQIIVENAQGVEYGQPILCIS